MKRILAFTGLLSALLLSSDAEAISYDFLPGSPTGPVGNASFSVQLNGLTAPTNVVVQMTVETSFPCFITDTLQTGCAIQFVSGGIYKPEGWFGPFNISGANPGIILDNVQVGSNSGESSRDGFNFTLTPSNNILSFDLNTLSVGGVITTVLYSLFVPDNAAAAVALNGQLLGGPIVPNDVPVPAALPLLAAGLGGLGLLSRRRKAKNLP